MRAIARQEAHRIFTGHISDIVDEAVKKTLLGLGLDISDPTEVQENFSNLRSWSNMKKALSESLLAVLGKSVFMGVIACAVLGFYVWITGHKPPP